MEENIIEFYHQNILNRNQYLEIIIKLLNREHEHFSMSLDGKWGSGKTVFLKQLVYLANENDEKLNSHNEQVNKFNQDYIAIYFDSWSYDKYDDPLITIIYILANQLKTMSLWEKTKATFKSLLSSLGYCILEEASKKFPVFSIIARHNKENEKEKQLYNDIISVEEKIKLINESFTKILEDIGKKKILFIIDELDRCNPNFAISVLETTKHIFISENINCIFGINKMELSKIITHYYGNIDSMEYLNKLFNYSFTLPKLDKFLLSKYIEDRKSLSNKSQEELSLLKEYTYIIQMYIQEMDLSLREINCVTQALDSINSSLIYSYSNDNRMFIAIFIYLYILKVKDYNLFNKITSNPSKTLEILQDNMLQFSFFNEEDRWEDKKEILLSSIEKLADTSSEAFEHYKNTITIINFLG